MSSCKNQSLSVARAQEALGGKHAFGAVQMETWLGTPDLGIEQTCGWGTHPQQVASETLERYTSI